MVKTRDMMKKSSCPPVLRSLEKACILKGLSTGSILDLCRLHNSSYAAKQRKGVFPWRGKPRRIQRDIETLSGSTLPGNGVTRFSYSQQDKQARDYLMNEIKELGLEIRVDAVGNIEPDWRAITRMALW